MSEPTFREALRQIVMRYSRNMATPELIAELEREIAALRTTEETPNSLDPAR